MKKRLLTTLLCFAMVLSFVPTAAFAAPGDPDDSYTAEFRFNAGEGTGSYGPIYKASDPNSEQYYELPDCPFTPPAGKSFKQWHVTFNGADYGIKQPGDTVSYCGSYTIPYIITAEYGSDATAYDIWVDGVQVTSDNATDILNNKTAGYDAVKNELTLNNYDGSYIKAAMPLNIVLADGTDNRIAIPDSGWQFGICTAGDCRLSGGGDLSVDVPYMIHEGIRATDGDLTVNMGGELTVSAGADGLFADNVTISGSGDVTVTAGEAGIRANFDVTISGSGAVTVDAAGFAVYLRNSENSLLLNGTGAPLTFKAGNGNVAVYRDSAGTSPVGGTNLSYYDKVTGAPDEPLVVYDHNAAPTTYTVTVQSDGNGTAWADKTSADQGDTVTLTAEPNSGYRFKEWQTSGVTITNNTFTMPESNVTVKAIFEVDALVTIPSIDITGADITPILGEKAGDHLMFTLAADCHYTATMSGWWDILGSRIMANDDVFEAGGRYCASWNFAADDGYAFTEDTTVTINGSADNVDSEHSYLDTTGREPLFIISAIAVPVEATYTITFDANDGSGTLANAVTGTDGKLGSLPMPDRRGSYRFDGWYTEAGGGTEVTVDNVYTADTTIYAHWTYTGGGGGGATYCTLTFDTNGGSAISSVSGTYGKVIDLDKYVPEKDGCDFGGWYSDSALTSPVDEIKLTDNKTVYAKWTTKDPNTGAELPFTDVKATDWSYEDIAYVYEKGLMQGASETTFAPQLSTSRAMIVTILWRLEGEPVVNYAMSFEDAAPDQWYTEAIRWAQANGIVNGYSAEKFGTNDPITREQMAAILYRYTDFKGYDVSGRADLGRYTDAGSISAYAKDAIAWANIRGLVTGTSAATLSPQGEATREQVAAILHRFCENIEK